jgi:FixJ family two-component response regulator
MIPLACQFCEALTTKGERLRREGYRVPSGLLISIIDDDDSFRSALVGLIRSLGYGARGFESAEEFVESGVMRSSACVITDIQMPGMSGLDLQHFLTRSECAVPVIMVTARTEPGLEQRALASGAICLLRKPFQTEALTDCLQKALTV